jgi:hypothetical protein
MNIDKFKHQHADIMSNISALRRLAQAGVAQNAADIARLIVSMSSTIKLHLAVEDQALYPALQRGDNPELARMGQQYQTDMGPSPRPTRPSRGVGTGPTVCFTTSRHSATTPTAYCAWCTNACSARTATSTRA